MKKSIDLEAVDITLPNGQFSTFDMGCIIDALLDSKKGDVYLEVGVDRGKSLAFAQKFFKGDVFGIDLVDHGGSDVKGANFILGDANTVPWTLPIKVLFLDGEHTYAQVEREWSKFTPFIVRGGWVFFHDADISSPGVEQFAQEKGATFSDNQRCSMAWVQL